MTELTLKTLKQTSKRTHFVLASKLLFLLKELFAVFVLAFIFALTIGTLWLSFTRSIYLVLVFLAIVASGALIPYWLTKPLLHPRRIADQYTPSDLDLPNWENVRFCSTDGIELHGWFIPPDPASNGATIVFVHGLGGNRSQLMTQAAVMIAKGYGALLFDLRNHGTSLGTLTTLGYMEAEDVRGAVDYALFRPEVNPEQIGLLGYSMGAAATLRAATNLPHIKAIVAESAYTSLEDNITQGMVAKTGLPAFPFAPIMIWFGERITGLHIHQIRPIDDVSRINHPILFLHGEQDKTVDVSNSRRLHKAANTSKGLYVIKNADHSDLLLADPVGFERNVVRFFDQYLRNNCQAEPILAG